jgi:hypothetical protein
MKPIVPLITVPELRTCHSRLPVFWKFLTLKNWLTVLTAVSISYAAEIISASV